MRLKVRQRPLILTGPHSCFLSVEGVRIKVKQKRQDIEDDHDKQKRKLEVTQKAKLQSLWSTINELNLALRKSSKEHVAAIADVETKHEESLNELNSEVRKTLACFIK